MNRIKTETTIIETWCTKCDRCDFQYYTVSTLCRDHERGYEPQFLDSNKEPLQYQPEMFRASKMWGYNSNKDMAHTDICLCESCFDLILLPFCTMEE